MSAILATVRAETFKLLRKRRIYVLAFLYWVLLPAVALLVGRLLYTNLREFEREGLPVADLLQSLFSAHGLATVALTGPAYMSPTAYIVGVVLLAALFIGEERGQNMWKTVLVIQPYRPAVMTGKLVVTMGALLALMLGAFLSAIVFGTIGTSFLPTDLSGDWLGLLGLYLWQWAHLLAAVLLAFLLVVRRLTGKRRFVTLTGTTQRSRMATSLGGTRPRALNAHGSEGGEQLFAADVDRVVGAAAGGDGDEQVLDRQVVVAQFLLQGGRLVEHGGEIAAERGVGPTVGLGQAGDDVFPGWVRFLIQPLGGLDEVQGEAMHGCQLETGVLAPGAHSGAAELR